MHFANQHGKSGTKTHFAIVTNGNPVGCQFCQRATFPLTTAFDLHLLTFNDDDDDDDTADIKATANYQLPTAFDL